MKWQKHTLHPWLVKRLCPALPCPATFRATHAAQLGARLTVLVAEVNIIHQGQTHGHRQQVKEVVIPSQDNQYLQQNLENI